MKLSLITVLGVATLAAGTLPSPVVHAIEASNATGVCQSALPVYDTEIRKRPTAMRNEGNAVAYVSCSLPFNYAGPNSTFIVVLTNSNAAPADVYCTFVDGAAPGAAPFPTTYYPQSGSLSAGTTDQMTWEAVDFGLPSFTQIANASCALPPGVEIAIVGATEATP